MQALLNDWRLWVCVIVVLLVVFEIVARALAEKHFDTTWEDDEEHAAQWTEDKELPSSGIYADQECDCTKGGQCGV